MFISELFEGKGMVPSNPKQKQGPAGQLKGMDKAPARNKLVGEEYDEAAFMRHMEKLKAQKELEKTDPMRAMVNKLHADDAHAAKLRKRPEQDDDIKITDPRHPSQGVRIGEATGLKKRVKIVKGPAAGRTGYVGEVHHGQFKGAPKKFVIDLDGGGNIMCSKDELRLIKDDMGEAMERTPDQGTPNFQKPMFGEGDNPQDEITVDVPLLIRLLEYAREDAKTDMDLHNVAENLIKLSGQGCLTMKQYNQIVGSMQEAKAPRKGTVAYNAAMQRKKQEQSPEEIKRIEKLGNQNHHVGNAKVIHKEMAPGRSAYAGRGNVPGMASA